MGGSPLFSVSHGNRGYAIGLQGFAYVHEFIPCSGDFQIILLENFRIVEHKVDAGTNGKAVLLSIHLSGSKNSLIEGIAKFRIFFQIRSQIGNSSAVSKALYPFAVPGKEQVRHIVSAKHNADFLFVCFVRDDLRLNFDIGMFCHIAFGQSIPVRKAVFFGPLVKKTNRNLFVGSPCFIGADFRSGGVLSLGGLRASAACRDTANQSSQ